MVLSRTQLNELTKAGLKKDQIDVVIRNLEELLNKKVVVREVVDIVVNKLVKDEKFRELFFKDPREMIMEANPQPSP
ncbi:MAG: hypothetical protein ACTSYB_10190 [Candidatus Helarchaeota archaeon]